MRDASVVLRSPCGSFRDNGHWGKNNDFMLEEYVTAEPMVIYLAEDVMEFYAEAVRGAPHLMATLTRYHEAKVIADVEMEDGEMRFAAMGQNSLYLCGWTR